MKTIRNVIFTLLIASALLFSGCNQSSAKTTETTSVPTEEAVNKASTEISTTETASLETVIADSTEDQEDANSQSTEATATSEAESQKKTVHFVGVGDNLIHPPLYHFADSADGTMGDENYDFKVFFHCIAEEIANADLAFINQETISGGDEKGLSGYPQFNTPRQMIPELEELGFDLVCMANNHALDKGISGIYHALYNWAKTDCVTSGVNADKEMRQTIPTIERNGVTFAFLAYTSHTNGITADTEWRVNYMKKEDIMRDVAKAKEVADFVIVSAHWGWDDVFPIDDFQREYAQVFADAGVDIVVGTGPHVLQHIEWIERQKADVVTEEIADESEAKKETDSTKTSDGSTKDKMLCIFSLGNYCSGMLGPFNELAGMITLDFSIEEGEKSIENIVFIPTVMHKNGDYSRQGVYLLKDYTEELAAQSAVNIYKGGLTVDYLYSILKEQIAPEFLPEEYR